MNIEISLLNNDKNKHQGGVYSMVKFSNLKNLVFTSGKDASIKLWDITS